MDAARGCRRQLPAKLRVRRRLAHRADSCRYQLSLADRDFIPVLDRNVDIFLGSTHARRAQDSASRTLAKGVTDEQVEAMSAWARKGVLEKGLREADEARRRGQLEGPKPTDDIVRHRHPAGLIFAGAQNVP